MRINRTPIAAALACMALASAPFALAAGDTSSTSDSTTSRSGTTGMSGSSTSGMSGSSMHGSASTLDRETVRQVQKALADKGHDPGPIDGLFGLRTAAAVATFQAMRGLIADGLVGPQTAAALGMAI